MSLNSQLVLPGHLGVNEIVQVFRCIPGVLEVLAVERYRPEHWSLTVSAAGGTVLADIFLSSWAKDDHSEVYAGESVFLTAPLEPLTLELFEHVARNNGGFMRAHEQAEWVYDPHLGHNPSA